MKEYEWHEGMGSLERKLADVANHNALHNSRNNLLGGNERERSVVYFDKYTAIIRAVVCLHNIF